MGLVVAQITKRVDFQGERNEFSNRYVYRYPGNPDEAECLLLLTALLNAEIPVHSSLITFLRGAVWGGGAPPNRMIASAPLVAVGTAAASSQMYRECAYLIKWPLPRAFGLLRSTQRSLKKWLHSCSNLAGTDTTGNTQLTALSGVSALQTYANTVDTPRPDALLVSPSDVRPNGPPTLHPYLEHHQFPRGRKRTNN
jgi:hypothetical protein